MNDLRIAIKKDENGLYFIRIRSNYAKRGKHESF